MKEHILAEIGLTHSEKKVYLALLKLGESTRKDIVTTSKIAGSKVYEVLEKLQEKGLVATYTKNNIKHFKPTNPKQLLTYLEKKKNHLLELEKETQLLIPQLLLSYNHSKKEQEVELVAGLKGLEGLFREQVDTLKKSDECFVIGGTWGSEEKREITLQSFFEKIHGMREKKKIVTKALFNKSQKEVTRRIYDTKKYPSTQIKYIAHASPVAINVYKNIVIIIILGQQVTSIKITSQEVADSFIEYFDLLWKTSQ